MSTIYSPAWGLLIGALSLFAAAAAEPAREASLQRFDFQSAHMGTRFTITLFAQQQTNAEAAADAAFHRVAALEDIMSDYQADSELNLLTQEPAGKPVPVSNDLFRVLQRARRFSELSDGAFDVTIGPCVRLWRFARKRKELPSFLELAEARESVGWKKLLLSPGPRAVTLKAPHMRLDLGGIAKGYAADQALEVLKSKGIDRALVAASGDIAVGSPPPGQPGWKIGISGLGTNSARLRLVLKDAGVSTSGDAEQFIEIGGVRYSHVINPLTGLGLTNRIQATVVARDATTTDALDTAICVLGPVRGLAMIERLPDTAALVIFEDAAGLLTVPSKRFEKMVSVE